MRVLVACEFSGIVREAFTRNGHDAHSCDLLPSEISGGTHYQCSIQDRRLKHLIPTFDLVIAHPPCTYLAVSGARWWKGREREQEEAIAFAKWILAMPVNRIAMENPIGKLSSAIRKPDHTIQPYYFGHKEVKATCFWLKNLPRLKPTNCVQGPYVARVHYESPGPDRWKNRSRTYQGIADAMASQWGNQ